MKYTVAALLLMMTWAANGTVHYRVDKALPSGAPGFHIGLADADRGWVFAVYDNTELYAYPVERRQGMFVLAAAPVITSFTEPTMIHDVAKDSAGGVGVLLGTQCEAGVCAGTQYQSIRVDAGWEAARDLPLSLCEASPSFTDVAARYVFNGCDQLVTPDAAQVWTLSAPASSISVVGDAVFALQKANDTWSVTRLDASFQPASTQSLPVPDVASCELAALSVLSVGCTQDGGVSLLSLPLDLSTPPSVVELEQDAVIDLRIQAYQDRLLWGLVKDDETVILHTDIAGAMYSERSVPSTTRSHWWASDDVAIYPADHGGGRLSLSVFAYYERDFSPQFLNGGDATIGSERPYERSVRVYDEDTLFSALTITLNDNPDWLVFDEESRVVSGTPSHADVGEWSYVLSATAGDEETDAASQTSTVTVTLSPSELMIYSQSWFELIGLDSEDPQPLDFMLAQLKTVQWNEDVAFEALFSVAYRNADEATVAIDGLPAWLVFDPVSYALSGTPTQQDVGEFALSVQLQDQLDEEASVVVDVPWQIREVDESFRVTSQPEPVVIAGTPYTYQLTTDDEETPVASMTLSLGKHPRWLSLNATGRLEGTPQESDVGEHRVQVVLTDAVGHTVLHSLDITVQSALSEDARAGGSISWGWLLLMGVIYARRRF
jgi:hypothetical protein